MKITWIRHGETDENTKGTYYGATESTLTSKGKEQIKRLKEGLLQKGMLTKNTPIYTSPLQRALQTTQILTTQRPIQDLSIVERNMGIFEGLTYAEIQTRYPQEAKAWEGDWQNYPIPHGESAKHQYDRVVGFIQRLAEKGEDALVITHSGVIRMALCAMLGGEREHFWRFRVEPGQVVTTCYEEGYWYITHLGEMAATTEAKQPKLTQHNDVPNGKVTLVTGGCRSGKSLFAEELLANKEVLYLATAKITDEEMAQRVKRHQNRRDAKWETYEGYRELSQVVLQSPKEYFLLDCLTILTSNFMFEGKEPFEDLPEEKQEEVLQTILKELEDLVMSIRTTHKELVIVTNEVGQGIVPSYALGRVYRDYIGIINQYVGKKADTVYEVKCGIPILLKGDKQ
jgi:adenosylcobinamide kinase/adenosylcobinamide-phosphate guanylyltransferase